MRKGNQDPTNGIPLLVLGSLCFVTLIMSQTQFKISKEMSQEVCPPVLRSKDRWFLYSIGNPDRFKCVLRAIVLISSPIMSLISTGLLLLGKIQSNPYFFIPWLFLTIKGLLFVQTENLMSILKDMATRANYTFGFRAEDLKWLIFYFTVFFVDLVETFSFYEIFDLFLLLWNHHPGFNLESVHLQTVKKEISDVIETLSKYSLGSFSRISLGSLSDSEGSNNESKKSIVKFSLRDEEKLYDSRNPVDSLMKTNANHDSNLISKETKKEKNSTSDQHKIKDLFSKKTKHFAAGEIQIDSKVIKNSSDLAQITNEELNKTHNDLTKDLKNALEGTFLEDFSKETLRSLDDPPLLGEVKCS